MKSAMVAMIASLAALAVACGAPQVKAVHLNSIATRIQALDSAYDKAHPGLASCEGSVYATLSESYLFMQRGLNGISPGYIMQGGHVITDPNPVTSKVYSYFYYQLGDYVAVHGTKTNGYVALTAVSGQGGGYAVRHGKLRLISSKLNDACLITLKGGSYPVAEPYPTTKPEIRGPAGCPGSAALVVAWKTAPAGAWGANPKLPVTGFDDITCWRGWVVANLLANANGMVVFSEHGALHMLSAAEFRQFNSAVCSSNDAPAAWKGVEAGPAICGTGGQ